MLINLKHADNCIVLAISNNKTDQLQLFRTGIEYPLNILIEMWLKKSTGLVCDKS